MKKLGLALFASILCEVRCLFFDRLKCPSEDLAFELMTGFVFTAPGSILDTRPGVLLLEDCISSCMGNSSCRSLNYETGLCVLFTSSKEIDPESLSTSQYPVFTLYAQKICVTGAKSKCPGKAWVADTVNNYRMSVFEKTILKTRTREECLAKCLHSTNFVCRSATFSRRKQECVLSEMDRHTTSSITAFVPSADSDYMESNCSPDPISVCNFKEKKDRILKTVDSVYSGVKSVEDCKTRCQKAAYKCHLFDYGDTGAGICRLSHHSSSTLRGLREPYLKARGATTYEMGSCYNVSVECGEGRMTAKITTNKVFTGRLYSKTRPNSCSVSISDSLDFSMSMAFNDLDCDVSQEQPGRFTADLIVQHHDMIVTGEDVGLKVRCNYQMSNRTLVSSVGKLEVEGGPRDGGMGAEATVLTSPNVTLRVTDRQGRDINQAKVGDPLSLTFSVNNNEKDNNFGGLFDIFVRDLVATDGVDASEILLVDSRGCPTDYSILGTLNKDSKSNMPIYNKSTQNGVLSADFDAFKFPTSDVVQFRALVTPCIPRCDPVKCEATDYYGHSQTVQSRGKRRRRDTNNVNQDLVVAGAIHISDTFHLKNDKKEGNNDGKEGVRSSQPSNTFVPTFSGTPFSHYQDEENNNSEWTDFERNNKNNNNNNNEEEINCPDSAALAAGAAIFVVIQIVLIFCWLWLFHRSRRRSKKEEEQNQDFDPYFGAFG